MALLKISDQLSKAENTEHTGMASGQFKLTNRSIEEHCLPPPAGAVNGKGKPLRQRLYFDSEEHKTQFRFHVILR